MIDGRLVDVLVADGVAGPDDERRAELEHALARPCGSCARAARCGSMRRRSSGRARSMRCRVSRWRLAPRRHRHRQERGTGCAPPRRSARACLRVTGSDRDDLGSGGEDLWTGVAQLRGVLAAVQSPEVAQEDENDRPVGPVVAEAVLLAVRAGQSEHRKSGKIHEARGYPRLRVGGEPWGRARCR